MVLNFVIINAAPGGPIEQVLARVKGTQVRATARFSGGGEGEVGGGKTSGSAAQGVIGKYRGAEGLDPQFIKQLEHQFGFDKPAWQRFLLMVGNFAALRLRQELLPRPLRGRPGAREDAGVDLARAVDHAPRLPDLHPARHRQGGARRLALRRLDLRRSDRRQRRSRLPVRHPADRALRRRALPGLVSAARSGLRRLEPLDLVAQDPRLLLAHDAAGPVDGDRWLRRPDHADQELVPRPDQPAVRADRARQGAERAPRALRPRLPQRHADRHRRLPRAPSSASCSPPACSPR